MIGCFMLLPLAGLLLAMGAVMTSLIIAMGALMSALTIAMGMVLSSLVAVSTAFMTFMILIFS